MRRPRSIARQSRTCSASPAPWSACGRSWRRLAAAPFEVFLPRMPRATTNRVLVARSAVGSTFMAALELARGAELALDQDAAFRGIIVTPLAAPVAAPVPEPVAAQAYD